MAGHPLAHLDLHLFYGRAVLDQVADGVRLGAVVQILGSLITAGYILRRVRLAKVQIEDTIFWLLFSAALLILAIFPGIAYWAASLLGFMSPINFVYVVIIFLLLAKQFFMSIRLSQLDSKVRILTEQVALNEEKVEREKLDL